MIKNLVTYVVKQLVEQKESVDVTTEELEHRIKVRVAVASDDLKRVIGREGRVVRAIQALVGSLVADRAVDVVVDAAQ